MNSLSSSVGTIIASYLGPCKSKKFVIDGKEVHLVKCPLVLLETATITDHFSYLVHETLEAHHQQFGCSVTSLLTMWYFWNTEINSIIEESMEISDIVDHSQSILSHIISLLPQIFIDMKQTICPRNKTVNKMNLNRSISSFKSGTSEALKSVSNCVPVRVRYSSRHYSPFQVNLEQSEAEEAIKISNETESFLKNIETNEELKNKINLCVQKLSHDDPECAQLVADLWIRQIAAKGDLKFCSENIIICPVTFSCSYTSVVDGVVLKSKLLSSYDSEISRETKAVIIKGSITFEYVHLGYNSKICVTKKLTPDEIKINEKDVWFRKCCDLLIKLQVNTVLVHGTVDTNLAVFCSTHSILFLSEIPWSTLEVICLAVKISPCTYLLDCNNKDIISNLKVKNLNLGYDRITSDVDQYFCINIDPPNEMMKPCSVILCHTNPSILRCNEHQLKHLMSRLSLASLPNSLLPGCGKTEEWVLHRLKSFSSKTDAEAKICSAIARGFQNYFEMVSRKIELKENPCFDDTLDEKQSKVQAWRAAMALTILTVQCDSLIVNDSNDLAAKDLHHNMIGNL